MKTAYTQGAQVSQNTTYLQGARQRVEFPGVVTLDQCDLKRSVMLNTAAKRYRGAALSRIEAGSGDGSRTPDPMAAQLAQMQTMAAGQAAEASRRRRDHDDDADRHARASDDVRPRSAAHQDACVIKQSSPSACDKSPLKVEMDAWYVDLPEQSACARPTGAAAPPPAVRPGRVHRPRRDPRGRRREARVSRSRSTTTTTTGEGDKVERHDDVAGSDRARNHAARSRAVRGAGRFRRGQEQRGNRAGDRHRRLAVRRALRLDRRRHEHGGAEEGRRDSHRHPRAGQQDRPRPAAPRACARSWWPSSTRRRYEAIPVAGSSPSAIEQDAARLECDYVMLAEMIEAKTSKPGKMGGVMRMTGGGPPKDAHDVKLDYKLYRGRRHAGAESQRQREGVERRIRRRLGAAPRGIRRPDVHGHDDGRHGHGHDEPDDGMSGRRHRRRWAAACSIRARRP